MCSSVHILPSVLCGLFQSIVEVHWYAGTIILLVSGREQKSYEYVKDTVDTECRNQAAVVKKCKGVQSIIRPPPQTEK